MGPPLTLSLSLTNSCHSHCLSQDNDNPSAHYEHPLAGQALEKDCSGPQARHFLASSHSWCWPVRDTMAIPPCSGSPSKTAKPGHDLDKRVCCKQIFPPSSMQVPHSPNSKHVFHSLWVSYPPWTRNSLLFTQT